jgi:V8-like Glu-specific endopeptidase
MRSALVVLVAVPLLLAADEDRRVALTGETKRPSWADAVAKMTWREKSGKVGQGSAVLVSKRLAITAYHCVKRWNGKATLRFGYDGPARKQAALRTAVEIVSSSTAGDWAILRLDKPIEDITPLKPATRKLKECDKGRMLLAGYSCDEGKGQRGLVCTYDAGCKAKKVRTEAGRILTDAICYLGASGGPAFARDKENESWHWFGIVQGNINADSKSGRITYVVYHLLYRAKLTEAIRRFG